MTSKVRVSVGLTVQLAPYNTARVSLDIEEDVEQEVEFDVLDELYQDLRESLVDKVKDLQQTSFEEGLVH